MRGLFYLPIVAGVSLGVASAQPLPDKDPPELAKKQESSEEKPEKTVEAKVLDEINALRKDPKAFAERMRPRLAWFEGNLMKKPGEIPLETNEGPKAVEEALAFLVSAAAKPLPPLELSDRLTAVAKEHTALQSVTGGTGHEGAKGENLSERIKRQANWKGGIAENINYGTDDPFEIVASLVIDDGVAGRGHRVNLFNDSYLLVGLDVEKHPDYRHMCVMVFARAFADGKR